MALKLFPFFESKKETEYLRRNLEYNASTGSQGETVFAFIGG